VVGGTAALALGFDVVLTRAVSVGGDVPSGPEGLLGNPNGVAFPARGENLKTEPISRALARVAGNMDVLYAEHARNSARLTKIGDIAAQTVLAGNCALVTPPGNPMLYTGYGLLSRLSTPEELAAFFLLIDPVTNQVAQSRVVGVVTGTVSGAPPYADSVGIGANGNVLGLSQLRSSSAIDDITQGRVVRSAGAFTNTKPGDIASITGLDADINSDPWDNRGLRWVVEAVTPDAVSLRPMSKGELGLFGTTVRDAQPVVELNDKKLNTQNFGTINIYTGTFMDGLKLVISPPMPTGVTYELWAAKQRSLRDESGGEDLIQTLPYVRSLVRQDDPVPNAIITRPTLTLTGANFGVGEFMARWHGRVIRIPATSFARTSGRIFWDAADALVKVTAGSPPATAHLIGICAAAAGVWTYRRSLLRTDALTHLSITVGGGQQFLTLTEALEYLTYYPAGEIVLYSSQTAPTGGWAVPSYGVHIRGATPISILNHGASGPLFVLTSGTLVLEDISLDLAKPLASVSGGAQVVVRNVGTFGGTRHALDSTSALDIGAEASSVEIGKDGALSTVRGNLRAAQALTVDGVTNTQALNAAGAVVGAEGLSAPATKKVWVGTSTSQVPKGPGADLSTDGTEGRAVFSKTGDVKAATLTKTSVDVLAGGATGNNGKVNADALHTHKDVEAGFTIGGVATDGTKVTGPALTNLTNGTNADALHGHTHGNQAGGSLHTVATPVAGGNQAGFMSAQDKTNLDDAVLKGVLQAITSVKIFSSTTGWPKLDNAAAVPGDNAQLVHKKYVTDLLAALDTLTPKFVAFRSEQPPVAMDTEGEATNVSISNIKTNKPGFVNTSITAWQIGGTDQEAYRYLHVPGVTPTSLVIATSADGVSGTIISTLCTTDTVRIGMHDHHEASNPGLFANILVYF
jgi:hypothetical protein